MRSDNYPEIFRDIIVLNEFIGRTQAKMAKNVLD